MLLLIVVPLGTFSPNAVDPLEKHWNPLVLRTTTMWMIMMILLSLLLMMKIVYPRAGVGMEQWTLPLARVLGQRDCASSKKSDAQCFPKRPQNAFPEADSRAYPI